MVKKKFLRRLLAATIAATVLTTPVAAFADDNAKEVVDATEENVTEELGDVKAEEKHQDAVIVEANNGHTADVTTGNLESKNGSGIDSYATNGSTVKETVNGNIDADHYGVFDSANHDSKVTTEVNGNVEGETGVRATAANYIFSDEGEYEKDNSTVDVNVNGNVNADEKAIAARSMNGGTADVTVTGDVTGGDKDHPAITASAWENGSHTDVKVGGDVEAKDIGVQMDAYGNGSENNVVIEGTLSAKKAAVVAEDYSEYGDEGGKNTITVWKIETPGYIAAKQEWNEETYEYDLVEDKEGAKNIQYIIRVNQADGATLKAADANGNALATVTGVGGKTLEYAYEGDKVLLKVDVADGYSLDAAYGDEGQQLELVKDANGNYYINVPAGGGVSFSVKLTKHEKDEDKDEDKDKDKDKNNIQNIVTTTDAQAVTLISSAAAGSAVTLSGMTGTGLSASVVAQLLLRRDVAVSITYYVDGVLYKTTIPAGADIAKLVGADGSISFAALGQEFGISLA